MKAVEFEQQNIVIAENQEEFHSIPAYYSAFEGTVSFCFELDPEELEEIAATGKLWVQVVTGGKPMQAILMSTKKEDVLNVRSGPPLPDKIVESILAKGPLLDHVVAGLYLVIKRHIKTEANYIFEAEKISHIVSRIATLQALAQENLVYFNNDKGLYDLTQAAYLRLELTNKLKSS